MQPWDWVEERESIRLKKMSIVTLLHRCLQKHDKLWTGPLTRPQYDLLAFLENHGNTIQTRITQAIHSDRSTVSDVIRRLKQQKYVHTFRSEEDGRAVVVKLTPEGKKAVMLSRRKNHRTEITLLQDLSNPTVRTLRKALEELAV